MFAVCGAGNNALHGLSQQPKIIYELTGFYREQIITLTVKKG
jgi:hypothetical protein